MLHHADADPALTSTDQFSQDTAGPAADEALAMQGFLDSPAAPGPATSLAKQLQQKGISTARGRLAASALTPRVSSPNPFQPHAHKLTVDAVTRTPSRFGQGTPVCMSAKINQ